MQNVQLIYTESKIDKKLYFNAYIHLNAGIQLIISPCDNKSASHWIMFDYFFHV